MAKPSTKGLLKEIVSDDIESVYIRISNKAVEWAIAGFIDEANLLFEQLWKFGIPHSEDLWLPDEGLQILWEVSSKIPQHIPFEFKNLADIEERNWASLFYACGDETTRSNILLKSFSELNDNECFFKAINCVNDNSENPEDILEGLKRFIKTDMAAGYTFCHATSCGALLAARNNLPNQADFFIRAFGRGYLKYWHNYILAYLMRDRKSAEYLLTGILTPVFNLTHQLIESETKEIINALAKRMLNGRTLVYKKLSWKQLLDKISEIAINQKTTDFSKEILAKKTLSKPSATDTEIRATEKRLNLVLPDDYKQFLITSNGFESFSSTGVTLAPIDKVDLFLKVDEQIVEIWADSMDEFDTTFGDKLRSSLIIGGFEEEQQLLLIPKQDGNWECWHFSSWRPGEVVYESFRFYMEGELQSLEDDLFGD